MSTRREALVVLGAAALAATRPVAANARPTFDVRDHGARGDGTTNDTAAIQAAIDAARKVPGARVLLPPGDYWLGEANGRELLSVVDAEDLVIEGREARLRCRSMARASPLIFVAESRGVTIRGLSFTDDGLDRNVTWRGAHAIFVSGYPTRGCSDIRVERCAFRRVLSAFTVSGDNARVAGIALSDLDVRGSYYGLNFQNNGDHVRGTELRFADCRRSYFPYGVDDHEVTFTSEANRTGSTDILIKSYTRPTSNLRIRATSIGKGAGDAIAAFEHQHVTATGVIRDVDLHLDVVDARCELRSVAVFRSYGTDGQLEARTNSAWERIRLDGTVALCGRSTRWLELASTPARETVIHVGAAVADDLVPARPRAGFRIVRGAA